MADFSDTDFTGRTDWQRPQGTWEETGEKWREIRSDETPARGVFQ
ncbi:MAG: hypothetical protein AAGG01_02275 [Planctomycetota bacterium]